MSRSRIDIHVGKVYMMDPLPGRIELSFRYTFAIGNGIMYEFDGNLCELRKRVREVIDPCIANFIYDYERNATAAEAEIALRQILGQYVYIGPKDAEVLAEVMEHTG